MLLPQTAIMACCDMFASLPEEMLSLMKADGAELHTSSLLAQLLLKVRAACFRSNHVLRHDCIRK